MKLRTTIGSLLWRWLAVGGVVFWLSATAQAALFEDDEARLAILDLRQRMEALRSELDQMRRSSGDNGSQVGRGLLELQNQIELMRGDLSALRGENERLARQLADLQRAQKDQVQGLTERIGKFEPVKVNLDGVDFTAEPAEKREFEAALAVFRKGEFAAARTLFGAFVGRFPNSGFAVPALFWLGNAQYALRDYKDAILNFRALVAKNPNHLRAPEAVLSIANCQLELKDVKGARKTLTDLMQAYPGTEAAGAAKQRLAALK